MCNYSSVCKLCGFSISVNAEHQNMQDITVDISSDCPNMDLVTQTPITLDAMYELMVSKEKSEFMKLMNEHSHPHECSAYDIIKDAIGRSLARYYEIA